MTAKETAIKNAYISAGVDWEQVKKYIDENGCVDLENDDIYNEHFDSLRVFLSECDVVGVLGFRPKSLSGIETNNGWITIESEKDLPSEASGVEYFVIDADGKMCTGVTYCNDNIWLKGERFYSPTHYQPIVKPKPPIY